ncbi:MAG: sensor histidine kinase, partial [Flavobacteriales bacterium]
MKLIPLTTRYYLLLFLVVLGLGSVVFYYTLDYAVHSHIDEMLRNRKNQIIQTFKEENGKISPLVNRYGNFRLYLVTQEQGDFSESYSDTLIYEPMDAEYDEYRKYESHFSHNEKTYRLTIIQPRLETGEMLLTVLAGMITLLVIMTGVFFVSSQKLSQKLWKPFYHTLRQLKAYRMETTVNPQLQDTNIEEFQRLNQSVDHLTDRIHKTWLNQKEFIENASHELQTPLANIQSGLEVLLENPDLTKQQAEKVQSLMATAKRMEKLNRSLLLLSRLDNQQLPAQKEVNLKRLITEQLPRFEEIRKKQNIQVETVLHDEAMIYTQPELIDILLTNLLKNAHIHNKQNGFIQIELTSR